MDELKWLVVTQFVTCSPRLLQLSEASLLAYVDQTEYSEADGYANNAVEAQEEVVSHHSLTVTLNTLTATILNTETGWTGLGGKNDNNELMQKSSNDIK